MTKTVLSQRDLILLNANKECSIEQHNALVIEHMMTQYAKGYRNKNKKRQKFILETLLKKFTRNEKLMIDISDYILMDSYRNKKDLTCQ